MSFVFNTNCFGQTFNSIVKSPFGLTSSKFNYSDLRPSFVDIDGDNDLDLFIGRNNGVSYIENVGSSSAPVFNNVNDNNPFGIQGLTNHEYCSIDFADMDDDGDYDAMIAFEISGATDTTIYYYENTGTSTNPQFGLPVSNPFGITINGDNKLGIFNNPVINLLDIDNDNDIDIFISDSWDSDEIGYVEYHENTGTNIFPNFASQAQINPFGLDSTKSVYGTDTFSWAGGLYHVFGDIDSDNDIDIISFSGWVDKPNQISFLVSYLDNNGTVNTPNFASPVINPFSIEVLVSDTIGALTHPALADVDSDGDLDIFMFTGTGYPSNVYYIENTSNGTGVSEYSLHEKISAYPNPSSDYIFIESDRGGQLLMFDVFGKMIVSKTLNTSFETINVSEIASGDYFIQLYTKNSVLSKKIIILHQ